MRLFFYFLLVFSFCSSLAEAQTGSGINKNWYRSDAGDFCLFSFSNVSRNGDQLNNIPRFIYLNSLNHFNKDLSEKTTFYTGFSVNNIGLIYDDNDSVRFKRRVITLGLSAGLKIGNVHKGTYFFLEGQMNMAVNYKEKKFLNDKKVDKSNTWFGKQTPLFLPSISAGYLIGQIGLKVQYFPTNFFNPEYETAGIKPFAGMQTQMLVCSISYNFIRSNRNKSERTGMNSESAAFGIR